MLYSKLIFFVMILLSPWLNLNTVSANSLSSDQSITMLKISAAANLQPFHHAAIWLKKNRISSHGYDAIDFIAASSQHGLKPNNYYYDQIIQLAPSDSQAQAIEFEYLLSKGLLALISDLSVGQFIANTADPDWFIPQAKFDQHRFLHSALLTKHLKQSLNTLIPSSREYHALMRELSRQQRYVVRGGWTKIKAMPLMRPGESHQQIPAVRARLAFEYNVNLSNQPSLLYDQQLHTAVEQFQRRHGLKVDGLIGNDTRRSMNISASQKVQQIKITMERHRWMPNDLANRYLMINLANYTLSAINNGHEELSMRVIVGKKSRPTPSFTAKINHLVFNPYWNVPKKLARLDLLPKQQADLNYFYLRDIHVFTIENGQKIEHDPYKIDWQSVSTTDFPYTFQQSPGEHNALGKVKFMFTNRWGIYLHDTSHRELFSQVKRSLSSGCIRVEKPTALANFSLNNKADRQVSRLLSASENRGLKLTEPLSIYAVYFTAWLQNDDIIFSADFYGRDQRIVKLL